MSKSKIEWPAKNQSVITGYITHDIPRYNGIGLFLFALCYDRKYFRDYIRMAVPWHDKWWLPRNWIHNSLCIINRIRLEFYKDYIFQDFRSMKFFLFADENDLPF